jgi:uncharacterized membrane protein YqjE
MRPPNPNTDRPLLEASKRFAQRLLTIAENRFELLMVEVQEERERLLRAIMLALGVAGFGLLAGVAITGAVAFLFWGLSRLVALLLLAGIYGTTAVFLYGRLTRLAHDWQTLPATIDQLRKDRACLEKPLN